jgi:hypothetical protein
VRENDDEYFLRCVFGIGRVARLAQRKLVDIVRYSAENGLRGAFVSGRGCGDVLKQGIFVVFCLRES